MVFFSMKFSSHVGCQPSRAKMWQNMAVTRVSHSCLLKWQSHCDLRVVRTTACLKAIMEVYGKHSQVWALKKNTKPVLLDTLADMYVTCIMF